MPTEIQSNILIFSENDSESARLKNALEQIGLQSTSIYLTSDINAAKEFAQKSPLVLVFLFHNTHIGSLKSSVESWSGISKNISVIAVVDEMNPNMIELYQDGILYLIKNEYHSLLLKRTIDLALVGKSNKLPQFPMKCFDELPIPALVYHSDDQKIIKANKAAISYFQINPSQQSTLSLNEVLKNEGEKQNADFDNLVVSSGTLRNYKLSHRGKKELVDLNVPEFNPDGDHEKILFVQPGTELLESGQLSADAGQLVRKLAENYPNGIIAVLDKSLRFLFCDGKELAIKQLTSEFMIGKKYTDFLDDVNRERFIKGISPAFEGEQVVFVKEMGNESFLIYATGLLSAEGMIDQVVLVSQNITGSVLAKKEVIFQANILKNISDLVVVKDMTGKIIYLNESASKLIGLSPDEILGIFLDDMNLFSIKGFTFKNLLKQLETEQKVKIQFSIELKDGRIIYLESEQFIMTDEQGIPAFVIGIAKDISERIQAEKVLKESEANLLAIFNSTSQTFLLLNTDCKILAFNKSAEEYIRTLYHQKLEAGSSFRQFLLPERREIFEENIKRVLNKEVIKFEQSYNFPGKEKVYIEITYSPVLKDGEVIGIIICAEDTTEKFKNKEAIFTSEKKYRHLVESSIDMIYTLDDTGKVLFANRACYEILGWKSDDLIGTNFVDFVAGPDKERVSRDVFRFIDADNNYRNYQSVVKKKNGDEVTVITNAVVHFDPESNQTVITCTSRDISARVKSERELNEKNEQLKLLSSYLQSVREEERSHIAREIHDELGQLLTGLKMDLAWLNRKMAKSDPEYHSKIGDMLLMVDETVKSVRKIASELRPGILDDLGLAAAIEWQCNEFEKKSGVSCKFSNSVQDIKVSRDVATGVFRILQESMTNIARHASASQVIISLDSDTNLYQLQISDNGIGFSNEKNGPVKTLGLVGMQERASMMGGDLKIESTPGCGTTIRLQFHETVPKPS